MLDPTKIVPEELVPVRTVGRMVLNRNPDNFFAETEQVAFCAAHIVPGIDFTNDPLLAGRIHSYVDTQISRLGGPNFHEIPINSPVAQVHNNQRDGMHRQAIHRGRVAYEPNSLGGGCPFQAGARGFMSFPQPVEEDKVRGKPEKFGDHYTQAALFYNSQTPVEQAHIVRAFRFELTKVQVLPIRQRVVSQLANVDADLARKVAEGLGIDVPEPQPAVRPRNMKPEVKVSPPLSLMARPGDGSIRTRCIALLVADGIVGAPLAGTASQARRRRCRAALRRRAARHGARRGWQRDRRRSHVRNRAVGAVRRRRDSRWRSRNPRADGVSGTRVEFVKDQYRHCKTILALGTGEQLLEAAGVPAAEKSRGDPGILRMTDAAKATAPFIAAVAKHRHFDRQTDPPLV